MRIRKIALILGAIMIAGTVLLAGCQKTTESKKEKIEEGTTEEVLTQMINPWTDCESLKDAEKMTGFSYAFPEKLSDQYEAKNFRVLNNELLEIIYQGKDKDDLLIIRQVPGGGQDIDGDYNEYSHDYEDEFGQIAAHVKGTKDAIYVCNFTSDGYSFSIMPGKGMTYDQMDMVIKTLNIE